YRKFDLRQIKKLILPALGFLTGFSLYILQFIRMSANFPLDEIMGPVVGSAFFTQLESLTLASLGRSVLTYLLFLLVQFGPLGIALGVIGVWQGSLKSSLPTRKIISFFIIYALFGIYYRVSDQFTFFITSYIFWALMMGVGMHYLLVKLRASVRKFMVGIMGTLLIATPFFYTALPRL